MTNERIIQIDSVDAYNKLYGWETLHPLVTVVNHANPMIQQTGIEPLLAETETKMMAWGPLGGQGTSGIVKSKLLATRRSYER